MILVLVLSLFFSSVTVFALDSIGVDNNVTLYDSQYKRLLSVFDNMIQNLKVKDNIEKMEISKIKTAFDFAGNEYTIVECVPTGYLIYSNGTGIFTECATDTLSPYIDYDEDIYYCGPTYYYAGTLKGDAQHTVLTEEIVDSQNIEGFSQSCEEYYSVLVENKRQDVLNYVTYGTQNKSYGETIQRDTTPSGIVYGEVLNSEYFYDMVHCGYDSGGICGYIGLGLLISYKEKYKTGNYMNDVYWYDSSRTGLLGGTQSLARYLRSLGSSNDTMSTSIKNVSEDYFENRGVNVTHTSILLFFTKNKIIECIDEDNPVLLFGSFENPDNGESINHAVTVYSYWDAEGDTLFTAHFGWDTEEPSTRYSRIYVYGLRGSMYVLE